jgi:hypothetical protein
VEKSTDSPATSGCMVRMMFQRWVKEQGCLEGKMQCVGSVPQPLQHLNTRDERMAMIDPKVLEGQTKLAHGSHQARLDVERK